ncbi:MAG: hypothetical protein P0Y65_05725 [Candidatus Devosia phytovorans]|uniref:Uncharacterized protein n=1 Tax=Candidatus Devosia phytovorans TaxID=3121372 RepID=A0AAJ6B1V6_9HYPH|nr:hypothetical protein [Devosia sp.]WEK05754.1 MAG: hypothetical protein P0Y65_05725 [Devosia sp.]
MRYFMRLFAVVLAAFALPFVALARAVESYVLPKLDHRDSLALDRAAHVIDTGHPMRVRAKAFVDRLLNHDLYVAGHFDPGRMPA